MEKKMLQGLAETAKVEWKRFVADTMKKKQRKDVEAGAAAGGDHQQGEKKEEEDQETCMTDTHILQATDKTKCNEKEDHHKTEDKRVFVKRERIETTTMNPTMLQTMVLNKMQSICNLPQEQIIAGFRELNKRQSELHNLQQTAQQTHKK